ncbi:Salivary acidic proline-rich phosphoprotein 1/2 [Entomophthora muscae]|uniref:Salivary acidic proline-rich phosphoprotein 1/2 n=1 Tax=Entomophthora muscae TaxID=34485 RepID=A0ACC2SUX6_9FUNG|nr:Salivary acidic proline-rich phosphoprotein 1/2 [Entomophthora muscae]
MPLDVYDNEDLGSIESIPRPKPTKKSKKGQNNVPSHGLKRTLSEEKASVQKKSLEKGEVGVADDSNPPKKLKEKPIDSDKSSLSKKETENDSFFGRSNSKFHQQRSSLPIFKARDQILSSIQRNPVTIIVSETGSGKSTQIPQYLLEQGLLNNRDGGVVVTQPRKVACLSLAERVAAEVGCKVGGKVGYSVRF